MDRLRICKLSSTSTEHKMNSHFENRKHLITVIDSLKNIRFYIWNIIFNNIENIKFTFFINFFNVKIQNFYL